MSTTTLVPADSESVTFAPEQLPSGPPDLRLIHFNDVYHLDPSSAEPVGGAARFQTVMNDYRSSEQFHGQPELITLFSGDVFNPSLESSVTKGSHMVPILNGFGTDCACVGNHDLDFGVAQFQYLTAKCNFPWLIANVFDPAAGPDVPIGRCRRTHMLTSSNGIKIGLVGLGEREWLETVNSLPPDIVYRSATETARELIPQLREQGADLIVILSHAREYNDNKLAEQLGGEADLILGGHDHYYSHACVQGTHVLRSGSDFKQLSYLEAWREPVAEGPKKWKWTFTIKRRDIVSAIPQDTPTIELIEQLTSKLKQSLEKPVGWTAAPLDARFTTVRLRESNLGNFVCDIMRYYYQAECVLMAAGTIRGDQIYPPGPVRIKDITDCFPFEDPVVVVRVTGKAIVDALENGVSLYPALEGRFAHVSNIKYEFDPSQPPGSRITTVEIDGTPADPERIYVLCTRGYMVRGKDGFKSLLTKAEGGTAETIVDEESGILISMMLRQYFMALKVMDQWSRWNAPMEQCWGRVVSGIEGHYPHLSPTKTKAAWPWSENREETAQESSPARSKPPAKGHGHKTSKSRTAAELREWWSSVAPFNERVVEDATPEPDVDEVHLIDSQLRVMRRIARKWCRMAGVQSRLCDPLTEEEYHAAWTRAIAPRVEGRIRIVGDKKEDA